MVYFTLRQRVRAGAGWINGQPQQVPLFDDATAAPDPAARIVKRLFRVVRRDNKVRDVVLTLPESSVNDEFWAAFPGFLEQQYNWRATDIREAPNDPEGVWHLTAIINGEECDDGTDILEAPYGAEFVYCFTENLNEEAAQ